MKKIRIVFILLTTCNFSILNAQTANLQPIFNKICAQKMAICSTKSIHPKTPPKKSLAVTKQRRLKSYQSNHKIARKRKMVSSTKSIACRN